MNIPVYNIVLGLAEGITKMSLVEAPAVESKWLAFEEQKPLKFSIDEEQRIVFGCAMRADFPIYRYSDSIGEYYVVFQRDIIKQMYEKFMVDGRSNNVNLNHDKDTDGVYMLQSFIKDTDKGIAPVGYEDVADGSWFVAYKVQNDEVWSKVKEGKFNGFSVEMYCNIEPTPVADDIEQFVDEIINK